MNTLPITVVIPVGPKPHHREYLGEMLNSIGMQRYLPSEVLIVNDGGPALGILGNPIDLVVREHINAWNLGMVASWNLGVGMSQNDLVLLTGADDMLYGDCIWECWRAWEREKDPYGYYYLGVKYSDGREQNTPCNAAMVTKTLWRHTGGIPAQCAVGAPDHIFLSMLLAHSKAGTCKARILRVCDDMLYWYRVGDKTETTRNIWPAIEAVKDWLHTNWVPQDE